jgi:hypothetical protein
MNRIAYASPGIRCACVRERRANHTTPEKSRQSTAAAAFLSQARELLRYWWGGCPTGRSCASPRVFALPPSASSGCPDARPSRGFIRTAGIFRMWARSKGEVSAAIAFRKVARHVQSEPTVAVSVAVSLIPGSASMGVSVFGQVPHKCVPDGEHLDVRVGRALRRWPTIG